MKTYDKSKINNLYEYFNVPNISDIKRFRLFENNTEFGDRSFSLIYAWQESFMYAYRIIENTIAVLEYGIDGKLSIILFYKENTDIFSAVFELYKIFSDFRLTLKFEYVSEKNILVYETAAKKFNKKAKVFFNPDDSDYFYETSDFLALEGKYNKKKRSDTNYLIRNYPDIEVVSHSRENNIIETSIGIFDKWCDVHNCEDCFYGCEKKAFLKFMEIFDEKYNKLCVSYYKGKPLSFALSEYIGNDTVCYYFQKNAERIRGLTYWLNAEMAKKHINIKYINLGEDMGINGIKKDKESLRPSFLKPKYSVEIL